MRALISKIGTKTIGQNIAGALLLGALALLPGCGETSFVEVTVVAASSFDLSTLSTVTSCEVVVSGADSDRFNLRNCGPGEVTGRNIGIFQYGTSESGQLIFEVSLLNNLTPVARGKTEQVMIKSGGRQTATVTCGPP